MLKLINIDKNEYNKFVSNNKYKSHFLQSLQWGEFSKLEKGYTPYYMGLIDENNNIVASCLLLQKQLPFYYTYFYCPRGFVLDYNKDDLFKTMTKEVVKFCKEKKGIFVKIDPDIIRKSTNYEEKENKLKQNPDKIFNTIKQAGFTHLGWTQNFETMQPRFTFRIDLKQDINEIESHFSKTTKQRINKAQKLDCYVEIGNQKDIDEFYNLMMLTENRKGFVAHNKEYYEKLYEILNKNNTSKAKLFLGKININNSIKSLEKDLKKVKDQLSLIPFDNLSKSSKIKLNELKKQKDNIEKEISKFKEIQKEKGNIITLSAHFIVEYSNKAWVLYAGNHNILQETYVNYLTYYEHLKTCKEDNIEIYDQFGTIGDLSKDNPLLGLHEFKKKFGGDYIEFLGEFDYKINRIMYFIFTKLVPIYRKIIRNKSKKELDNEVSKIK